MNDNNFYFFPFNDVDVQKMLIFHNYFMRQIVLSFEKAYSPFRCIKIIWQLHEFSGYPFFFQAYKFHFIIRNFIVLVSSSIGVLSAHCCSEDVCRAGRLDISKINST